jgi:hypothetical protein
MVAFIVNSSVSLSGERGSPPHDEVERSHLRCRFWPHLVQSAAMVDHSQGRRFGAGKLRQIGTSPAFTSYV